jgi:probable F420-dependent oxidoreductase
VDAGVAYFPTHDAVGPGELARMVEARGHRWLYFAEHTHIPASRESPAGGREGAPPLARKYAHTYDLFVALATSLAATSSLRVGSGICLVTERDPIITAKEVASLDHLSGGRFEFGVGAGWNREEMANHGTDPRTRMRLMRDRVLAMKEIWTNHEATYHGEFVDFERIWCDPKPLQRPHPPILIGGGGPTVHDRVLEYGDAWMPNHRDAGAARIAELRERAGRRVPVVVMGPPADPAALEPLAQAGVDRVLFWLPSARRAVVEAALDGVERAMADLHGAA